MENQASKINNWGKNVFVKIPVTNSKGMFTGKVIKNLSKKGIKLNITAVYSFSQVKKIVKSLNKGSKSIISIFAGRMADKGIDPVPVLKKVSVLQRNIKILIFCGRALVKCIIIFRLSKLDVI